MRFQAMCLEAFEVAPSSIMECRPHSGPERCKYFCVYKFSFIGLQFMASLDFQCVFKAIIFKRLEHTLKQHNTARWDPPVYPVFCTNTSRMNTFITWSASFKQTLQNLSNAGFFLHGKVQ